MHFIPFVAALIVSAHSLIESELSTSDYTRVILLPDVHGDLQATIMSLYMAHRSVDKNLAVPFLEFREAFTNAVKSDDPASFLPRGWKPFSSTPNVVLIQLGDMIDRGPFSVECVRAVFAVPDLIGWDLRVLYGNHELMAMAFPAKGSRMIHLDDTAYMSHGRWALSNRDSLFMSKSVKNDVCGMSENDGKMFELLQEGSLAALRLSGSESADWDDKTNPATLFVHAGIEMDWLRRNHLLVTEATEGSDESPVQLLNSGVDEFVNTLHLPSSVAAVMADDSAFWTRTLATDVETAEFCQETLGEILKYFNVARIVVGHTPQSEPRAVRSRCGGRVLVVDVGVSKYVFNPDSGEEGMHGAQPSVTIMEMSDDGVELEKVSAIHWWSGERSSSVQQLFPVYDVMDATFGAPVAVIAEVVSATDMEPSMIRRQARSVAEGLAGKKRSAMTDDVRDALIENEFVFVRRGKDGNGKLGVWHTFGSTTLPHGVTRSSITRLGNLLSTPIYWPPGSLGQMFVQVGRVMDSDPGWSSERGLEIGSLVAIVHAAGFLVGYRDIDDVESMFALARSGDGLRVVLIDFSKLAPLLTSLTQLETETRVLELITPLTQPSADEEDWGSNEEFF